MKFEHLPEFDKDLKQLNKKYLSLQDDLIVLKQILTYLPQERVPFSFRINHIPVKTPIIKIKKIACKSLKGRGVKTGLRLIYAYFELEHKIILIELYHKNEKSTEDRIRIIKNIP